MPLIIVARRIDSRAWRSGMLPVHSPWTAAVQVARALLHTKRPYLPKKHKTSNEKKLKTYITYLPTSLTPIQERQRADSMKPMVWYTTPGEVIACGVAFFLSDFVLL